jgi:hypothetical protein
MHCWNIFGVKTNHEQTRTHKTHHGPGLREATTFPLIIYFVTGHGTNFQMAFCLEIPKWDPEIPKIGILTIMRGHNFVESFLTVCRRPPTCEEIEAILDF